MRELKLGCEVDEEVTDCLAILLQSGYQRLQPHQYHSTRSSLADEVQGTPLSDLQPAIASGRKRNLISQGYVCLSPQNAANDNLELEYPRILEFGLGYYVLNSGGGFGVGLETTNGLVLDVLGDPFVIFLHANELHISTCSQCRGQAASSSSLLRLRKLCPKHDGGDPEILRDFGNSPDSLVSSIPIDCLHFSTKAFKGTLQGRNEGVEDALRYYGSPAIEGLKVYGKDTSLSDEDRIGSRTGCDCDIWIGTESNQMAESLVEFDAEEQVESDLDRPFFFLPWY